MMGAGKSLVGRMLAERLGLPFVDCDNEITRRAGCSIPEMFDRDGEAAFRTLEADVIRDLSTERQVVALGGGAAAQPGMIDFLAERGTIVYLKASLETLLARIGDGRTRPLMRGLSREERADRLKTLQREREPSYSRAHITIRTAGGKASKVVDELVRSLDAHSSN
jgi:3-dehydroquinate synthase